MLLPCGAPTQVMAELPSHLRQRVAVSLCQPLVAVVHIFEELPQDLHVIIAEALQPLRLPAGPWVLGCGGVWGVGVCLGGGGGLRARGDPGRGGWGAGCRRCVRVRVRV